MPENHDIIETQNKFFQIASFPRVIGCIDGTHVKIQSPGGADGEIYRNRKGYFSVNVQVVGDSDLKVQNIVARWPGSQHDNTMFTHSNIKFRFESGEFQNCVLLGDSGYALRNYLLTPITNPVGRGETLYNEAHIRTRNSIERSHPPKVNPCRRPTKCHSRPPMAPRPSPPRGPQPTTRMPGGPRPPMNNRAPGMRPRAPMIRPRGAAVGQPVRSPMRPRMNDPGGAALQAKRRKVDVLTPSDKDDDDCQVICMQPKNTGLPQIESIQGASESVENSIMKLSDSITLSVRNPPLKPAVSPQKSDAKAVANVLASRGITVTASAKPKESPTKQAPGLPTALSLNGAVSIVAKNTANAKPTASDNLPTVDLTEDSPSTNTANSPNKNRPGLPYRCDLCPAQYPNAMGLNKHRQTYHKTTSGMRELGVPLINIKQPGIMQKLTQIGINNYIPLPSAGPEGTYAPPIISTKNPGNVAALGATQMLSLGPVRTIPRPGAPNNNVKK